MARGEIRHVNLFKDRHNNWRAYYRRPGWKANGRPLPGATGPDEDFTPEFLAAYSQAVADGPLEAVAPQDPVSIPKPGTLSALRAEYLASAEFRSLKPSTQREYRYAIEAICRAPNNKTGTRGDGPVDRIERRHILRWRDALGDKPGAANKELRVLKLLMSFAVDRDYRKDNPASKIKELKAGRWRSWTDAELVAFEGRWPLGTLERTGYALAYYTGARREDVTRLRWEDIAGKEIVFRTGKTGVQLHIPMHAELCRALAAVQRTPGAILKGKTGKPLSPVYFGHLMAAAIDEAGLPDDCVLHGLRKATARTTAELGGDVASLTGHLTPSMVAEYTRDADQKRLARRTIAKWNRAKKKG